MSKKELYDRKEFCEKIVNLIEKTQETSLFIIYSDVGVGKSTVSKKVKNIIDANHNKEVIVVRSAQENDRIQEGLFLKNTFKSIAKYYEKKVSNKGLKNRIKYEQYRFISYLKKKENFTTIIQCINDNFDNLTSSVGDKKKMAFASVKTLLMYILMIIGVVKDIKVEKVSDPHIMMDYIKYILNSGNIILNLDNVQNFDNTSLEKFLDCLIDTKEKNNFVLFEFTLFSDFSNLEKLRLIEKSFDNADIANESLQLDNLDIEDVVKIAYDNCTLVDKEFETLVVDNYGLFYKGNLKKVEDFASIYSKELPYDTDPTFEKIRKSSSVEQFILGVVINSNAIIKKQILELILEESALHYTPNILKTMCENNSFLEDTGDEIKIVHSSIIDSWNANNHIFKKYDLLAYQKSEKVYSRMLENELFPATTKQECLLLLFKLYNKFEFTKLNDILPYIDEVIYDFMSVNELERYLKSLVSAIKNNKEVISYIYSIIEIAIRFQMYSIMQICLDKIENILDNNLDEKFYIYQYIRLLQSEDFEELDRIFSHKKTGIHENSDEFNNYSLLVELLTYKHLGRLEECQRIIEHIQDNDRIKNTVQYAYFLRLAEIYDRRDAAIPKVEKSINLFSNLNLPIQVAKSRVSLAFLYAISGKINEAVEELAKAENVLLKNIENKYVFNINKACIQLLKTDFSEETWNLLDEIENYTKIKFDQIAIVNDKLIWCIENSDYSKAVYLQKKGLELLAMEPNKHLHAIFYYNCYVLNERMGNHEESAIFYSKAQKNKEFCRTLKARLEGKDVVEDNTTFLLSKPWHVCFVSYGYFDFI